MAYKIFNKNKLNLKKVLLNLIAILKNPQTNYVFVSTR